jgi:hypothetical protein
MRTNPLFTGEAPTDASATVTQLKIAARGKSEDKHTATLAAIDDEVRRSQVEWRRTLDAVKETLATLERTCESAIETHEAGIPELVETLARRAREEAIAAAQQTRAQADIEIEELRRALERHDIDLQAARVALASANDHLETELGARSRAENERDAVQRINEQIAAQLQTAREEAEAQKAELSRVRQQLEAETAERSRLVSAFQAVQNALSLAQFGQTGITPLTPSEIRPLENGAHGAPDAAPAPHDVEPDSVADDVVVIEPFPEVAEHAQRLLEQAEAMYWTDLNSGRPPIEVVDRLTAILRYSRDLIVERWGSDECDAAAVFQQQVGALLDAKVETSFGRHLSIASFAARSGQAPAAN